MEVKTKLNLDESNATLKEDLTELDKAAIGTVMAALSNNEFEKDNASENVEQEIINNAYSQVLRDLIQDEFTIIGHVESAIATIIANNDLDEEKTNNIVSILKEISDQTYVHVGMLQKANSEVKDNVDSDIETGENVAALLTGDEEGTLWN